MFYIRSLGEFCASNKIDDEKRNAGLKTPDGIKRFDDIRYADHERNILDVYRPKEALPLSISVTGLRPNISTLHRLLIQTR